MSEAGLRVGPLPGASAPIEPVAQGLRRCAEETPWLPAIVLPRPGWARPGVGAPSEERYVRMSFGALDAAAEEVAFGLRALGLEPGDGVALMVPPSEAFFVLTFGLLKAGLVPVLIDPGIGLDSIKTCLAEAEPVAFVGVPKAVVARRVLGWCPDARQVVGVAGRWARAMLGATPFSDLWSLGRVARRQTVGGRLPVPDVDALAAVVFTSGSTGIAKGVEYTHRNMAAQVDLLRATFGIERGARNIATFPPFALFGPALGMTTLIPHMDATRPRDVDPREVIDLAEAFEPTMMFGSPALLDTVSRFGAATGARLPHVTTVMSAGAPVPPKVQRRMLAMLPSGARIYSPYGATECLPVANISSDEVFEATAHRTGICVGRPVPGVDVAILRITDEAIEALSAGDFLPAGEVGEVVVRGPHVTRAYHRREEATRLAKTRWEGQLAHRMGDLGWFDDAGRLWFAGRKSHRVETRDGVLFSVPVEEVFGAHPRVHRTALVGVGARGEAEPVLWVELEAGERASEALRQELLALGAADPLGTGADRVRDFRFHPGFPVDIRHNSKIRRERLAEEAAGRGGRRRSP